MKQSFRQIGIWAVTLLILLACSTEKNVPLNRFYHGTTAHYNGYFNANELLKMSLQTYREGLKEDYYKILPLEPLPNETEVIALYPSIDTAIAKCSKVIQAHSMPSNDRPSKKKVEYNPWIDENWITVGIADYYRRDYDAAFKNFQFVKKFYSNDPSLYVADLWLAKINIIEGRYTEAGFNILYLDKAIEAEAKRKEEANFFKRFMADRKVKKKDRIAKFPKKIRFEFEKVKAELALRKNEKEAAITFLEESLKYAKKRSDKARVHFILGQLYETTNQRGAAQEHYALVLKYNGPYELMFTARLKRAFMGGNSKLEKDLKKMLRDVKNSEYKDQIYYALADMELQKGNQLKAKEYLTQSAFYSVSNTRQKGMAYEKLGNMSFAERDYVAAQKYYDSCAIVINDQYPNYEGVKKKADKLSDLVSAVEVAQYEDSVQKIAQLSESDREDFIKDVIKKIKKDAEIRKKMEAERLRELQKNQSLMAQTNDAGGNKWYWNNAKARSDGFDEFRRLWGTRVNEDNWRRSEKVMAAAFGTEENDSTITLVDSLPAKEALDTLTVEALLAKVPLTDSALALSKVHLLSALYDAGIIYKEQLLETKMAEKQFIAILDRKEQTEYNVLAAYQLYRIYQEPEKEKAEVQKEYILNMYPNSDYANYLRDPDYFIKKKERDALAEEEYLTILDRYNRKLYMPVVVKADAVITNEKDNAFRPKYMLLKAMSLGQLSDDKTPMVPVLDQLIKEYTKTPEQQRATELLSILKTGVSKNDSIDFSSKSIYKMDDNAKQWVLIFLEKNTNSNTEKTKVSNFNREFFSTEHFNVSSKIYTNDQSVILVDEFETDLKAKEYVRIFKNTRKHLLDLQNAKIVVITKENFRILYETKSLQEYEDFFLEYY